MRNESLDISNLDDSLHMKMYRYMGDPSADNVVQKRCAKMKNFI